jgi:hypothetical protein
VTAPEADPKDSSESLKERMQAAWPADKLRRLGPLQRRQLSAWVEIDRAKEGDDYLTVPVLEGMLEMLETYFPEEIIGSPQVLAAEAEIAKRLRL